MFFFCFSYFFFFFFNDTATTEIYTLSLHDALPICRIARPKGTALAMGVEPLASSPHTISADRKSTRLNSSHLVISYAVFCLKKKKKNKKRENKKKKRKKKRTQQKEKRST